MIKKDNKKALSEIVSYVLLIVIAMALAAGVFAWVKFYIPQEKEKCSEDVSLSISEYSCSNGVLTITLANRGYFNVDGFFVKASNESGKIPATMLSSTDNQMLQLYGPGKYDFNADPAMSRPLKSGEATKELSFIYAPIGTVKVLQIQPYVKANKTKGNLLCSPIQIRTEDCESGPAIIHSTSCIDQECDNNPADGIIDAGKTCSGTFNTWYNNPSYIGIKTLVLASPTNWIVKDNEWLINTSSMANDTSWYWFQGNCSIGTYERYISINSTTGGAYGTQFPCNQRGISYC